MHMSYTCNNPGRVLPWMNSSCPLADWVGFNRMKNNIKSTVEAAVICGYFPLCGKSDVVISHSRTNNNCLTTFYHRRLCRCSAATVNNFFYHTASPSSFLFLRSFHSHYS